tara:strand:- start:66 stop:431 length:366 start_codon:yes stop_codon:yes gene_type:complete
MAIITISFNFPINVSVQRGDIIYAVTPTTPGTTSVASMQEASVSMNSNIIGRAVEVRELEIDVNDASGNYALRNGDYIMFSKDKEANTSGLLGYYMRVMFTCDSKEKAELFAIGSDVTINS